MFEQYERELRTFLKSEQGKRRINKEAYEALLEAFSNVKALTDGKRYPEARLEPNQNGVDVVIRTDEFGGTAEKVRGFAAALRRSAKFDLRTTSDSSSLIITLTILNVFEQDGETS